MHGPSTMSTNVSFFPYTNPASASDVHCRRNDVLQAWDYSFNNNMLCVWGNQLSYPYKASCMMTNITPALFVWCTCIDDIKLLKDIIGASIVTENVVLWNQYEFLSTSSNIITSLYRGAETTLNRPYYLVRLPVKSFIDSFHIHRELGKNTALNSKCVVSLMWNEYVFVALELLVRNQLKHVQHIFNIVVTRELHLCSTSNETNDGDSTKNTVSSIDVDALLHDNSDSVFANILGTTPYSTTFTNASYNPSMVIRECIPIHQAFNLLIYMPIYSREQSLCGYICLCKDTLTSKYTVIIYALNSVLLPLMPFAGNTTAKNTKVFGSASYASHTSLPSYISASNSISSSVNKLHGIPSSPFLTYINESYIVYLRSAIKLLLGHQSDNEVQVAVQVLPLSTSTDLTAVGQRIASFVGNRLCCMVTYVNDLTGIYRPSNSSTTLFINVFDLFQLDLTSFVNFLPPSVRVELLLLRDDFTERSVLDIAVREVLLVLYLWNKYNLLDVCVESQKKCNLPIYNVQSNRNVKILCETNFFYLKRQIIYIPYNTTAHSLLVHDADVHDHCSSVSSSSMSSSSERGIVSPNIQSTASACSSQQPNAYSSFNVYYPLCASSQMSSLSVDDSHKDHLNQRGDGVGCADLVMAENSLLPLQDPSVTNTILYSLLHDIQSTVDTVFQPPCSTYTNTPGSSETHTTPIENGEVSVNIASLSIDSSSAMRSSSNIAQSSVSHSQKSTCSTRSMSRGVKRKFAASDNNTNTHTYMNEQENRRAPTLPSLLLNPYNSNIQLMSSAATPQHTLPTLNMNSHAKLNIGGGMSYFISSGVYSNVYCFDVKSCYPSMLLQFNLSPETCTLISGQMLITLLNKCKQFNYKIGIDVRIFPYTTHILKIHSNKQWNHLLKSAFLSYDFFSFDEILHEDSIKQSPDEFYIIIYTRDVGKLTLFIAQCLADRAAVKRKQTLLQNFKIALQTSNHADIVRYYGECLNMSISFHTFSLVDLMTAFHVENTSTPDLSRNFTFSVINTEEVYALLDREILLCNMLDRSIKLRNNSVGYGLLASDYSITSKHTAAILTYLGRWFILKCARALCRQNRSQILMISTDSIFVSSLINVQTLYSILQQEVQSLIHPFSNDTKSDYIQFSSAVYDNIVIHGHQYVLYNRQPVITIGPVRVLQNVVCKGLKKELDPVLQCLLEFCMLEFSQSYTTGTQINFNRFFHNMYSYLFYLLSKDRNYAVFHVPWKVLIEHRCIEFQAFHKLLLKNKQFNSYRPRVAYYFHFKKNMKYTDPIELQPINRIALENIDGRAIILLLEPLLQNLLQMSRVNAIHHKKQILFPFKCYNFVELCYQAFVVFRSKYFQ